MESMRSTAYLRYAIATVALLLGFALSIRLGDRGVIFDGQSALATPSVPEGEYNLQALEVFNRVVGQLGRTYVEPERIEPHRLLVYALDRVQNAVPEVVALFNADIDDGPTEVEVRVGAASQRFELGQVDRLWEVPFKLREVLAFLQANVSEAGIDLREVEYEAVNGMLSTLDPHTVLLRPRVYSDMQMQNQGEFGGLGIVISIRENELTVISPINDTPASRAGFRAGDRIVKINSESTVNMPLDEAVSRLRGRPGTTVTLEVMRTGWTEPHRFELTREQIPIVSVEHEALGDGIGYVSITNFQQRTHQDMLEALDALRTEMGELRGLVLDLRNNPGGLLTQAVAVSDTFLAEGRIVTTVGLGDQIREEQNATASQTQGDYPIVVLVNAGSASASEIVAGALKAHNRAVVMGETTFGKGTVQIINAFADGSALKITMAKYLTPGDVSIQGVGIVPDIRMIPVSVDEDFVDLYPPEHVFREGDLQRPLSGGGVVAEATLPSVTLKYYAATDETSPDAVEGEEPFRPDFEINAARQVLLAAGDAVERQGLLARSAATLSTLGREQLLTVQERLRTRNIDWTPGSTVVQPVTVEVSTSPTGGRVHAGDPVTITMRVTNDGDRPLHQVRAVSAADYLLLDDREFVFGRVAPGETVEWSVTVPVPVEDPNRATRVDLKVYADMIPLEATAAAQIEVVGRERPHWALRYQIDDSDGNGDGLLQVGERVRLHVDVLNTGAGASEESIVEIRNMSDAAMFLHNGRDTVASLAPGATHRSTFDFTVNAVPEDGVLRGRIHAYDTVFRELLGEDFRFDVTTAAEAGSVQRRAARALVLEAAPIHAGASASTPVVGQAPAGASLPVSAEANGLVRVDFDDGFGWIEASRVQTQDAVAAPPSPVEATWSVRPPTIDIEALQTRTDAATVEVRGTIEDDDTVRDFYVVVTNSLDPRRVRSTKFDYRYIGAQSFAFEELIPIRAGTNQITVVARDTNRVETRSTVWVYRDE